MGASDIESAFEQGYAAALTPNGDAGHSCSANDGHTIKKPSMFNHTQNENGTYNTRCLDCLLTIASSIESPRQLEEIEAQHLCPEKALANLLSRERSPRSLVLLD